MWRDKALFCLRKLIPGAILAVYSLLGGGFFYLLSRSEEGHCRLGYWESLYFASSIYTTIGNAKVHVCSNFEKFFAIVYAMAGIPLNYIVIVNLGEVIELLSCQLWQIVCRNHLLSKVHPFDDQEYSNPVKSLRLFIGFCLSSLYLLIMASLFSLTEGWSFGISLYFVASSVTTLGYDNNVKRHFDYTIAYQTGLILGLSVVWIFIRKLERLYKRLFDRLNRILHVDNAKSPSDCSVELSGH